ncbi:family 20 glycosylhydrolase [Kribbella sp. NPDC050459]|uniref:family 20 glycosylhydrolase n=1 Tax=Kribbella sp. NPDC050459 TaxID=3155785 RepID=UPI0034007924
MPSAQNPAPTVVPALQTWTGGVGQLTIDADLRVVSADPALRAVANQVAADLRDITGWRVPITTKGERPGDLVLALDPEAVVGPDTAVAVGEGYRLEVTDRARIAARTATGVFWGTRTALQMLRRETPGCVSMPVGSTVDWPNYAVRGFMMDLGRRWFGPEQLSGYIRYMSWFKLNTFQLHLNDNAFKPKDGDDWSTVYSAFRLASDNPRFAPMAATDGALTRREWHRLEDLAADHQVMLVPEIDAPAHARAFIAFKPEIGLDGGNSDHLDLTNPEATSFMKEVFAEFVPWFRSPVVHVGADEYPRAHAAEYKQYFNDITSYVRGLGKQPAAWGSFTMMSGGAAGYDRGVTINSWNNGWYDAPQAIADGYPVINSNDALLYIVPFANYYHGQGLDGRWLYDSWEPHVFADGKNVPASHPLLRGAMSAVWNDLVDAAYDGDDVHRLVEPSFGVLAHKMWRGAVQDLSYADFMARVASLGTGPGTEKIDTPNL